MTVRYVQKLRAFKPVRKPKTYKPRKPKLTEAELVYRLIGKWAKETFA